VTGRDEAGQFMPGNRFWEARSTHGRNPIFASPGELWDAAAQYFDWVEANPLYEDKLTSYQGANTHEPVAKMRAMTISGLCIFLDIARRTWDEYRERADFLPVVTRVEEVIRTQKFEGAAADLLNPNIIARDLGLADKQEHQVQGEMAHKVELDAERFTRSIAGLAARSGAGESPE
jgi:hypothetical protein